MSLGFNIKKDRFQLLIIFPCGIKGYTIKCLVLKRWKVDYDIIKNRSYATRSGKGNQPLNIKTAVE